MRIIISGLIILLLSGCMEMCGYSREKKLFLPKDSEAPALAKRTDSKKILTLILEYLALKSPNQGVGLEFTGPTVKEEKIDDNN